MDPIYKHMRPEFIGSGYDKTKIRDKFDYDVMMTINKRDNHFDIVKDPNNPGWAFLVPKQGSEQIYAKLMPNSYLDPQKVYQQFLGDVQKGINEDFDLKDYITLRKHGVAVQQGVQTSFQVDLVIALETETKDEIYMYVAKKMEQTLNFNQDPIGPNIDLLWQQAMALEEKRYIKSMDARDNGIRKQCLRIAKAIVNKDDSLQLMSYQLKTVLMHVNDAYPKASWQLHNLAYRMDCLLHYLEDRLRDGKLSHYYIDRVNLFVNINTQALTEMADRIHMLRTNPDVRMEFFSECSEQLLPIENRQHLNELHDLEKARKRGVLGTLASWISSETIVESDERNFLADLFYRFQFRKKTKTLI